LRSGSTGGAAGSSRGAITGTSTGSTVILRDGPGSDPRAGLFDCDCMGTTSNVAGSGFPEKRYCQT
jgi:hypothetical protein